MLHINKPALRAVARLYLVGAGVLLLFVIAFQTGTAARAVVIPFTRLVTVASSLVMNLFGAGSYVGGAVGNTLSTASYSINVVDGCNGIYATAILISGVIAYPSRLTDKAWGILFGIAAVFVLNLGRVISLFYLGQRYPDLFDGIHVYVWQPIIIIWAIFVWDFWARRIGKDKAIR